MIIVALLIGVVLGISYTYAVYAAGRADLIASLIETWKARH